MRNGKQVCNNEAQPNRMSTLLSENKEGEREKMNIKISIQKK
jgi:hypothetical protein